MKSFSLLLVAVLLLSSCNPDSIIRKSNPDENIIPGAYQALNFMADQRDYPGIQLPENAHFHAWQQQRESFNSRNAEPTDPWQSIGPHNFAGRTLAMAFNPQNPNTIFAGSASGGLWRSSIGGVGAMAWEYVDTKFPVLAVSSIAFAPGDSMTMYIGTGEVYNFSAAGTGAAYRSTRGSYGIGILKSIDGGRNWTHSLNWSFDQNRGVWAIRVHPQQPNIVYAATTHGVYKSMDGGSNWNQVLDIVMANDLLIHPQRPDELIVGCGNFGTPGKGIYKTTNAGLNWTFIQSTLPTTFLGKIQLALTPTNPDTIYASIGNGFTGNNDGATWLCRSADFGSNWTIQNTTDYSKWQGWFSHDVAVNPFDPTQLIAIGIEVYSANNSGTSITQRSTGGLGYDNPPVEGPDGDPDYTHSDSHDILYHPTHQNTFYVAHDGGIHRSTDNGNTYHSCNSGMQTVQFYNGFSNSHQDSTFCIGGLQDNGSIRWNGDFSWRRLLGGDGSWSGINPLDDNTLYVSWQGLNMMRSDNRGNDLTYIAPSRDNDPAVFIAPFIVDQIDGAQVIAGATKVYKSDDFGDNWMTLHNDNALDGNPILSLDVAAGNKDLIYAATAPLGGNRGHVFVSKDGFLFNDVTGNLPDRYPMDIAIDPTDEATAYIVFSGYGSGHVFKTVDYGENWIDISGDLPDVPVNAVIVDPIVPLDIYIGNDLGVFASIDGGESWETYQDGLPTATMVFDLKISSTNRKLRVATHGNGAYERDLLESIFVSTEDPQNSPALNVALLPNPAQGPFRIIYQLPAAGQVQIRLLDSSGRNLKNLLEERQSAGNQELSVENIHAPAGLYFVQLETVTGMVTKRLVIR